MNRLGNRRCRARRAQPQCPMRPRGVVVGGVTGKDPVKMPLAATDTDRTPAPERSSRHPPLPLFVMTTGSHHYQVYWTSPGGDRSLVAFPLAYLKEAKRWIPRESEIGRAHV